MVREVDLVSYLPPFIAEYKETNITLTAENPEFTLVWKAVDQTLRNEFIATADEHGLSRFEKLLGIYPAGEDTLEGRRNRVQNRWLNALPYTLKRLLQKLRIICEDNDFTLKHNFAEGYTLTLDTNLEGFGKVQEVEETLTAMMPCNIKVIGRNAIDLKMNGRSYLTGVVACSEVITILSE